MPKKRRFPLATLLKLRRRDEDQAKAELGKVVSAKDAADRVLAQRYAELTQSTMPIQADPATFAAIARARTSNQTLLSEAQALAEMHERRRTEAQQTWREKRSASEAIGRLKDRHDAEVRREALRDEQHTLDDVSGAAHVTDQRTPEDDA